MNLYSEKSETYKAAEEFNAKMAPITIARGTILSIAKKIAGAESPWSCSHEDIVLMKTAIEEYDQASIEAFRS